MLRALEPVCVQIIPTRYYTALLSRKFNGVGWGVPIQRNAIYRHLQVTGEADGPCALRMVKPIYDFQLFLCICHV